MTFGEALRVVGLTVSVSYYKFKTPCQCVGTG